MDNTQKLENDLADLRAQLEDLKEAYLSTTRQMEREKKTAAEMKAASRKSTEELLKVAATAFVGAVGGMFLSKISALAEEESLKRLKEKLAKI